MQANDAWSAVAELAASQHGAIHARQAAGLGIDRRRLATSEAKGLLRRISSRVFVFTAAEPGWRQRLMCETLIGGVASHRAAAQLHGLDGFTSNRLDLTAPRGRRPSPGRVRLHHYLKPPGPDQITVVDSIPCTTVPMTLVHLAADAPPCRVEQALDSALRLGTPELDIRAALERSWRKGPTGLGPMLKILDDPARTGTLPESWFERRIARSLSSNGLPPPVHQFELAIGDRRRRFHLAYPDVKLAIEGHSRRFHSGHRAEEADNSRDIEVSQLGWEIIYVTWEMLEDPSRLAATITRIYRTRRRQLRVA